MDRSKVARFLVQPVHLCDVVYYLTLLKCGDICSYSQL